MLTLVIGEHRPTMLPAVQRVFRSEPGTEIAEVRPSDFARRSDLDALVMLRSFALDRYGALFSPGVSGVVSTKEDSSVPSWVVTTPGFPGHLEFDDSEQAKLVRDGPELTPAQETLVVFNKIFDAIEKFNASTASAKIERLGCDLELINTPLSKSEPESTEELESIRTAFRRFRESSR